MRPRFEGSPRPTPMLERGFREGVSDRPGGVRGEGRGMAEQIARLRDYSAQVAISNRIDPETNITLGARTSVTFPLKHTA